jgi:hypothetical protein
MQFDLSEKLEFNYEPFIIEAGKVKEFARILGFKNQIYFDKEMAIQQGLRGIPVPPTFVTVIDHWNDRDFYQLLSSLKLNPNDILHGEQSYEYLINIIVGDTIRAHTTLLEKVQKKGKEFLYLEAIYKNQLGEKVLISKYTLVHRLEVSS